MNKSLLKRIAFFLIFSLLPALQGIYAQEQDSLHESTEQVDNYKEQIKRLVGFLQFSMNTLGDPETSVKEKEIIINESYIKAFLNEKVQIEDDLDENREMVTHKDVQAYLKDVDFFFQYVEFDIDIQDIQPQTTEDGMLYFKVTANRHLQGVTVEEDTVNNTRVRYIEINLDDEEQVLKIASIYTTKINEKDELMAWWNILPSAWKEILGNNAEISEGILLKDVKFLSDSTLGIVYHIPEINKVDTILEIGDEMVHIQGADTLYRAEYDTVPLAGTRAIPELLGLTKMESLDISGNLYIRSLEPIEQLTSLRSLNFSNTLADDLFPVRNLTKLEVLNISGTPITDISPLKYNIKIRELYLDGTNVKSLDALANLTSLETLHINFTQADSIQVLSNNRILKDLRMEKSAVTDIQPLAELTNLEILDISGTAVTSLDPLQYLTSLKIIYLENTQISEISALSMLNNLQVLDIDKTQVSDLEPLMPLETLQKVYCNQSGVLQQKANEFMLKRPGVIVIYESEALTYWWQNMAPEWKAVFRKYQEMGKPPTVEQLHELTLVTELDISDNFSITSLNPLGKLPNLMKINCKGTSVNNLEPIEELIDLKYLDCSETRINDLNHLKALVHLKEIDISNTKVTSLEGLEDISSLEIIIIDNTMIDDLLPLKRIGSLRTIYCDDTRVGKVDVDNFLEYNPGCLIIYETPILSSWWKSLTSAWKEVLRLNATLDEPPTREQLHSLVRLEQLDISGHEEISSLSPLTIFNNLIELDLANTMVNDISPLESVQSITGLNLSGNPINDFQPVSSLVQLISLDISNTPIEKLDPLEHLGNLEYLNCSGTPVKKLNPIETLFQLRKLEINNTNIKNIKPLESLVALRQLKCFNTPISSRNMEKFREANPQVEVVYY